MSWLNYQVDMSWVLIAPLVGIVIGLALTPLTIRYANRWLDRKRRS